MAKQPDTHSSIPQSAPHEDPIKPSQVPVMSGFLLSPNGDMQMFPIMYPAFIPNLNPYPNEEHMNRGAGLYAVPVLPYMGPVSGLPSNTLIPLTYSTPTRPNPSEVGAAGIENEQAEQQQLQHQQLPGPQRQVVVRRFQIAIQLDLLLILKLAAVIFLFNQDGSRQRLALLVFAAILVYLYQTGALAPVIRCLSQGMRRAAAPPQPPRPADRAGNVPAAPRQENEGAVVAEGPPGVENTEDGDEVAENENLEGVEGNNRWWGIVKEVQMIVFGFITSLLPGFHHVD